MLSLPCWAWAPLLSLITLAVAAATGPSPKPGKPGELKRQQRAERARRALEALEVEDDSFSGGDGDGATRAPLHVVWDFDNKRPENLDAMTALLHALPTLFPDHDLQKVRLYASYGTLRHVDCHQLMGGLFGQEAFCDFLQAFPEQFPHGARFPIVAGPESGADVTLIVVPARPQAADHWLVRDTAKMVAPLTAKAEGPGTICLVSDDSDFRQVISDIHHSGWRCTVLSQEGSWTLRKRADQWFDWNHFCAATPSTAVAQNLRLLAPEGLPEVDLVAHQRAQKELRWARDWNLQRWSRLRHLRGPK